MSPFSLKGEERRSALGDATSGEEEALGAWIVGWGTSGKLPSRYGVRSGVGVCLRSYLPTGPVLELSFALLCVLFGMSAIAPRRHPWMFRTPVVPGTHCGKWRNKQKKRGKALPGTAQDRCFRCDSAGAALSLSLSPSVFPSHVPSSPIEQIGDPGHWTLGQWSTLLFEGGPSADPFLRCVSCRKPSLLGGRGRGRWRPRR